MVSHHPVHPHARHRQRRFKFGLKTGQFVGGFMLALVVVALTGALLSMGAGQ